MKIAITGATGLMGRRLVSRWLREGHAITVFSRNPDSAQASIPQVRVEQWDALQGPPSRESVEGLDVLVNLAGASIASGRWTARRKALIRDSRVAGTRYLVDALSRVSNPPAVLIQASAVGYYGDRGEEELEEASTPGTGFLPEVCVEWEAAARPAETLGTRVVWLRSGVVFAREGGALSRMLLPFRLFAGGPLGCGEQYLSWIHIEDQLELIGFAIERASVRGPLNAVSPGPIKQREFARIAGNVLRRPSFIKTPAFILKAALGEMADALLLASQRVYPCKAGQEGFSFRFAELKSALANLGFAQK